MKKLAICFTLRGAGVIRRINEECGKRGVRPVEAFFLSDAGDCPEGFIRVSEPLRDWTEKNFLPGNALIFVGAVGIAVRAIAGSVSDKLTDCPVLVTDDRGTFVIPILSGHAGGANKLSAVLSRMLGAIPVITTSTDVNGAFSADTFAVENNLLIRNREGIKKVSLKALEGKKITLSIKDYPPKERADCIIADETDAEYSLLLSPKRFTVGLGMKRNKDPEAVEEFFLRTLEETGIGTGDVYALCTIDIKEDEPGIINLRDRYRLPLLSFEGSLLKKLEGDFSHSDFVEETLGVDNVCERAAIAGAGVGAELVLEKKCFEGMTIAVARRGKYCS